MSVMKLTYFNGRGRAEVSRLALAQAGVKYEDIRIAGEDWGKLKASGKPPFGQLPILEVNGKVLGQSRAIENYIALENGLKGKGNMESAQVDMVQEAIGDISKAIIKFMFEKDEAKKEEFKKDAIEKTIPNVLASLEKILVANNGGKGYIVGGGVTIADLCTFDMITNINRRMPDAKLLAPCPKLAALVDKVGALPKIAEWVKKRPETSF